jgi:hypothetical protein
MPVLAVSVVVLHENTVVFVNTLCPGIIHGRRVGVETADRGVWIPGVGGLPIADRIRQIVLSDRIGVGDKLQIVIRDPLDLSAEAISNAAVPANTFDNMTSAPGWLAPELKFVVVASRRERRRARHKAVKKRRWCLYRSQVRAAGAAGWIDPAGTEGMATL